MEQADKAFPPYIDAAKQDWKESWSYLGINLNTSIFLVKKGGVEGTEPLTFLRSETNCTVD